MEITNCGKGASLEGFGDLEVFGNEGRELYDFIH